MSEAIAATITVGGVLPISKYVEFYKVLFDTTSFRNPVNVQKEMEKNRHLFLPDRALKTLVTLLEKEMEGSVELEIQKDSLYISDYEAKWGTFSLLEEYCVRNNLTFIRDTEGYQGESPVKAYYTKGMEEPFIESQNNGDGIISKTNLLRIITNLSDITPDNIALFIKDEIEDWEEEEKEIVRIAAKENITTMAAFSKYIKSIIPEVPKMPPLVFDFNA